MHNSSTPQLGMPGGVASRAAAVRSLLSRHWSLRLLVLGTAVKLLIAGVRWLVGTGPVLLDVVDVLGSLALVLGAVLIGYGLAVRAKRRLLWRVRRKLILSYIFIGFVPALLIVAFFAVSGLMLIFNVGSYLVRSGLADVTEEARFIAETTVRDLERDGRVDAASETLTEELNGLTARYADGGIALVPTAVYSATDAASGATAAAAGRSTAGVRPLAVGRWAHVEPPTVLPAWVTHSGYAGIFAASMGPPVPDERSSGLLLGEDILLVIRAVALPSTPSPRYAVVVDIPVTELLKARLQEATSVKLGEVSVVRSAGDKPALPMPGRWQGSLVAAKSAAASAAPQGQSQQGRRVWVALFEYTDWTSGWLGEATMSIEVNIADIYDRISAGQVRGGASLGQVFIVVLVVLAILFLIIEFAALVMGLMLAKSITGSVHQLFAGTERARQGDFGYKIAVVARDQLGELAESFNQMTGSIEDLMRQAEEKRRLEEELRIARSIQMSLLPQGQLSIPGFSTTALCVPAREVGGDYYDLLPLGDGRYGLLIADVSGKGTSAAFYMAELKGLMLSLSRIHRSPRELLINANRIISDHLDSRSFITMIYAVVDVATRTMTYARAGHTPLIMRSANGDGHPSVQVLVPDGMVLGVRIDHGEMFERLLVEQSLSLGHGDLLLFFTDGISEAMNADSDCFGESRLARLVEEHGDLPPDELRERILREIQAFVGDAPQHDDMTMILLKVDGGPAGSGRDAGDHGAA
jgi:sigma-B regulation protein RsbU (phosphoserine phosphatase)